MRRCKPKYIAIRRAKYDSIICFTQTRGIFGNHIQYRLNISR